VFVDRDSMTTQKLLQKLTKQAKQNPRKIVFPEALDERVLRAAAISAAQGICIPILLGDVSAILTLTKNLKLDLKNSEIINHINSPRSKFYANKLYNIRKKKGMTLIKARNLVKQEIYFGTLMVHCGDADGLVAGAVGTTADTLIPALQIIEKKQEFHRVSSTFLMIRKKQSLFFADAAVNVNPSAAELAEIAIDTAETAKKFGIKPKVAMLSFSTKGSAEHELIDKVRKATQIVKKRKPNLIIDGEMQVDAAIVPKVCARKCPSCKIQGNANVLIFPDLQSANIAYKLVERLGGAKAIGPLLQGFAKPINDLSRGCSVEDIITMTAITVVQAQDGW